MTELFRNQTALITGASSGIGEVFARELGRRGMNLVLVARSADKLDALAKELASQHGIQAIGMSADLSALGAGAALYRATEEKGLQIDLLINNAGFGSFGEFQTLDRERELQQIQLNVTVLVDLTRLYLPRLLERGTGGVINVASTAGFQPVPNMAVYGATKAFVLSFSEALWGECRGKAVRMLAVCPGATETAFFSATGSNDIEKQSIFSRKMTSEQVVTQSLRAYEKDRNYVVNGFMNWLLANSGRFGPRWLTILISRRMMGAAE